MSQQSTGASFTTTPELNSEAERRGPGGPGGPGGRPGGPGGPPPMSTRPGPPAEFVRFVTPDRMMLHALLFQPAKGSDTAAIYVPGFGGGFACPNDLNPVAEMLNAAGYAFFAINLRTVAPPGIMFARFEDCEADIQGAIDFLKMRGFKRIVLIGDSLGAPRSIHYLKQRGDQNAVSGLVILGGIPSPYLEAQQRWEQKDRDRFDRFLETARAKVKAGESRELLTFEDWFPGTELTLSAATFLNLFGPPGDSNAHAVDNAPCVRLPTLVLHGSQDSTSVPANGEAIYNALENAPQRELVFVECDHFFFTEDQARRYGAALCEWLQKTLPAGD